MVASVLHTFVSAKGDGTDPTLVKPSDWNAQHAISGVGLTGKQCIPIPAVAMVPDLVNGAQSGGTGLVGGAMVLFQAFDQTAQESVQWSIPMPDSWDEGTITFKPLWCHSTATSFGVVWELSAVAASDGDAVGLLSLGTAQISIDTGGTSDTLYIGPESSPVTVAGSPQQGDLVFFRLRRVPAHASDTLNADARLMGVKLFITTAAGNDA
jgi:hypothetical protein